MKILFVTELWPPYGGSFILDQAKAIAPFASVTVAVLAPYPPRLFFRYQNTRSRFRDKLMKPELIDAIPVYYLRYRTIPELGKYLNSIQAFRALARFLRNHRDRFDLIHAHFAYTAGFAAVRAGRSLDLPAIVTAYGSDINFYAKRTPNNLVAALFTIWGLRHATALTALSHDLATKIESLGISRHKITVIPLGINETIFFPHGDKSMLRRKLQLPNNGPLFLFVGNWVPVKGLTFLFEALVQVCRKLLLAQLVMIGHGVLQSLLQQQAQQLDIDKKIIWAGPKAHAEIPMWMSAADFLVLPSLSEGYGLVVLESLACGTPVIASRVGGIPEILVSSDFGTLVPARDSDALAQAILDAVDRDWDHAKLVAYAKANTWSERAQRFLKIYQTVIENTAATTSDSGLRTS